VNVTTAENDGESGVIIPVSGKRYMVKFSMETISDDVRAIIANEAPRQSVSKEADGFVLGMFDNRDEVELLVSLLSETIESPIEIVEIELNE
jgi:hypothetical protein